MTYVVELSEGFQVSDDTARLDMGLIHAFLAKAYWAHDRPPWRTERAIAHSICFGLYASNGAQAGFARVLSDLALRAHLADVFVVETYRGRGLGRGLVGAVLDHPDLCEVGTWSLSTRDAHGLYAQFGFGPVEEAEAQMMRRRP